MPTNLAFSTNVYQIKHCIWKEKSAQEKSSKIRLTGLAAGNAYGERLPMFVIGCLSNKPRCFKSIRNLPCRYRTQRKSWMTAELFEECIRQLGQNFSAVNRKIAFIIDNCTNHPHLEQLYWIDIPASEHHITCSAHGSRYNSRLKSQVWLIGRLKTDRSIRKEKSCTNHIDFIFYDDAGKGVEWWNKTWNKTFTNCFKKAGSLRKKWKKCLMTKMTPLLA